MAKVKRKGPALQNTVTSFTVTQKTISLSCSYNIIGEGTFTFTVELSQNKLYIFDLCAVTVGAAT